MPTFTLTPAARVHGPRTAVEDDFWGDMPATIVLEPDIPDETLDGIEDFSHLEILFVFDRLPDDRTTASARHPRHNPAWPRVGVFAQRAKLRPNRLGATICRLVRREGRTLHVVGLDAIEGTPVLDIKPVFQEFLPREPVTQPAWSHELMRDYWRAGGER